jgi:hypothetical protein
MRDTHALVFSRRAGLKSKCLSRLRNPALVALLLWGQTSNVPAQTANRPTGTVYGLKPDATFAQGCFAPCLCPVMLASAVKGTFVLTPAGFDGLFSTYAVGDVNWVVSIGGSDKLVTGKGTYKLGGEVALQQELSLDLQVDGATVEHFDSGLVQAATQFPVINVTISVNGQVCFDTVFGVSASPMPLTLVASGPYVILRWPTNAAGLTLQSATNLVPPMVWTTVARPPILSNGQNAVTNPISATRQFYRLISWVIPSTSFVLQQNPDLTATNWTDVATAPVLNLTNLQNQVTLPPPSAPTFYRLQNPAP